MCIHVGVSTWPKFTKNMTVELRHLGFTLAVAMKCFLFSFFPHIHDLVLIFFEENFFKKQKRSLEQIVVLARLQRLEMLLFFG